MYELKVSGMKCGSCAEAMGYSLQQIDPNSNLEVDVDEQTVQVRTNQPESVIFKIVEDAGYSVIKSRWL